MLIYGYERVATKKSSVDESKSSLTKGFSKVDALKDDFIVGNEFFYNKKIVDEYLEMLKNLYMSKRFIYEGSSEIIDILKGTPYRTRSYYKDLLSRVLRTVNSDSVLSSLKVGSNSFKTTVLNALVGMVYIQKYQVFCGECNVVDNDIVSLMYMLSVFELENNWLIPDIVDLNVHQDVCTCVGLQNDYFCPYNALCLVDNFAMDKDACDITPFLLIWINTMIQSIMHKVSVSNVYTLNSTERKLYKLIQRYYKDKDIKNSALRAQTGYSWETIRKYLCTLTEKGILVKVSAEPGSEYVYRLSEVKGVD